MTTIAYHGSTKTLAADKKICWGDTPAKTTKIFKTPDGVMFGSAGGKDNAALFRDWMLAGCPVDNKPQIKESERFTGIAVKSGKIYQYNYALIPHLIELENWSCGSGCDYALAVMAMGGDAVKAVEVASQFDIHTGLGIDTLTAE